MQTVKAIQTASIIHIKMSYAWYMGKQTCSWNYTKNIIPLKIWQVVNDNFTCIVTLSMPIAFYTESKRLQRSLRPLTTPSLLLRSQNFLFSRRVLRYIVFPGCNNMLLLDHRYMLLDMMNLWRNNKMIAWQLAEKYN